MMVKDEVGATGRAKGEGLSHESVSWAWRNWSQTITQKQKEKGSLKDSKRREWV